jgi:hypothetical protein
MEVLPIQRRFNGILFGGTMNPVQVREQIKDKTGVTITKTMFRDAVAPGIGVPKSRLDDEFDLGNERGLYFYVNCIIDRGPRDVSNRLATWVDANPSEASAEGEQTSSIVSGDQIAEVVTGDLEQTDAESDLDADAPDTEPTKPATPARKGGPKPTEQDRKLARVLDATQARLLDIPPEWWVERVINGVTVQLYWPTVEVRDVRMGDKRIPCYVYRSLDPTDGIIAITAADYERHQNGDWSKRHMPMVTTGYWESLLKIFRGFSTYTHTCSIGGERFDPLLKSKARMFLRKLRGGPFSEGPLEPMLYPQRCYTHWVLEQVRPSIQRAWMQATVDLQHLRGDPEAMAQARADRMEQLIREVYETVRKRNHRITIVGVANAFVAYADSVTANSTPKE